LKTAAERPTHGRTPPLAEFSRQSAVVLSSAVPTRRRDRLCDTGSQTDCDFENGIATWKRHCYVGSKAALSAITVRLHGCNRVRCQWAGIRRPAAPNRSFLLIRSADGRVARRDVVTGICRHSCFMLIVISDVARAGSGQTLPKIPVPMAKSLSGRQKLPFRSGICRVLTVP